MTTPEIPVTPIEVPQKTRGIPVPYAILGFILTTGLGFAIALYAVPIFNAALSSFTGRPATQTLDLSSLQETYNSLQQNFDGDIDQKALVEGAQRGMVNALGDEYTIFMNSKEAADFDNSLTGNIGGGIGVEIGIRNERPTVVRVLRDNPAEKAGIRVGDIITAVNDKSVVEDTTAQLVLKIRGDVGTSVKLTVLREGKTEDISVTREQVNNPSVYSTISDGVGVMTISRFDGETGRLARQVAQDFKDKGVKSIVLDLRGNGGGFVSAAEAVSSLWLNDKVIVVEKAGSRVIDEIRSGKSPMLEGIPTVVLVNKSSASASEIVAGALRDNKAATLVGETTFGKGSVQKIVNLTDGAQLKVTIARWYTPAGLNISEKGITPDQAVELTVEDLNANRDPQLEAAKVRLNQ